jgi:hypothetical protein
MEHDNKSEILLSLLDQLMGEMKMESGKKLKPKEAVLEVTSEPEVVDLGPAGEHEGAEPDGDELSDEEIAEALGSPEEEVDVQPKSLASSRLAKRLAAAKTA